MAIASGGLAKSLNLLTPEENSTDDCQIHKSFKARVKTFVEGQKWVRRPLILAPSVCAQYGWKCISSQLLECDTCMAKLSAGQPNVQSYQAYKACVEHTRECLKTAHKKHCPWPITPCSTGYVQMVPLHKEVALKEFKKRFELLMHLETGLPQMKESTCQELGFTEEVCTLLHKLLGVEPTSWSRSAMVLAATGWKREFEAKLKMSLSCDCCQRVVSLMLYSSVWDSLNKGSNEPNLNKDNLQVDAAKTDSSGNEEKSEENNEQSENSLQNKSSIETSPTHTETPAKRTKFMELLSDFDPLFEHRPWCLWVIDSSICENSSTQDELSSSARLMPGWKLFVKCLLRNTGCTDSHNNVVSPLKEQLNNARNMLESWNTCNDSSNK